MSCKHFLVGLTLLFSNFSISQAVDSFDQMSYVVEWAGHVDQADKSTFLDKLNSTVLCEFEFGGRQYAWLEFTSFPFRFQGKSIIDINGGVTPAQSQPEIDNFIFDSKAELFEVTNTQPGSCQSLFDFLAPIGNHPVSIFNLDTGVNLPICDNSTSDFNFCGPANCSIDYTSAPDNCSDNNGHGTHGLGIQQNIINSSIANFGGSQMINIENFTVFDSNGKGNLGAILCALADVLDDPSPRKVVNCSFSFYSEWNPQEIDPLFEAFKELAQQNIFSVTSAGNEGLDLDRNVKSFPACYFSQDLGDYDGMESSTICIGAADCNFEHAFYSNYSLENVDISTLGSLYGPDLQSGLIEYTGTSQATFASSAIAAILMSNQASVDLSDLKCSLISGATTLEGFRKSNKARGVVSAMGSYEMLISGKPCEDILGFSSKFATVVSDNVVQFDSNRSMNSSIYPNPVSDNFTYSVDIHKDGEYSIAIVSASGKVVDRKLVSLQEGMNRLKFDEDLENGIYYIHLEGQDKMKNSRFVKL